MRKQVNALGDVCPVPVVKTKNAIKELGTAGGSVETLVDNEIAVQNLTKMARQKGYPVKAEKMEEQRYRVVMEIAGDGAEAGEEEPVGCKPDNRKNNEIVVISSEYMGEGDPRLGRALMKSYLYALTCQEELPDAVIFYNGGVKLTCGEGEVLEDLRSLEAVSYTHLDSAQWKRLKEIFVSPSLQMVTFTITEKGYALQKADGTWFRCV